MKRLVTVFCFFFVLHSGAIARQQKVIDSLERELAKKTDFEDQMELLNDIAFEYLSVDPHKGIQYADRLIEIAVKNNHPMGLAMGNSVKAGNLELIGQDSLAVMLYLRAIGLWSEHGEELQSAVARVNLADVYTKISKYQDALVMYQECLAIFERLKKDPQILYALNGLGITYFYLGDHLKAIDYYYKGIKLAESLRDNRQLANLYLNIGLIYKRLGKYKDALHVYAIADSISQSVGDKVTSISLWGNMGSTYDEMNDSKEAIRLYEKALAASREISYKRGEGSNLANLGVVYFGLGEHVLSMDYMEQALEAYGESPSYSALSLIYEYQARLLTIASASELAQMGIKLEDRFPRAEQLALKARDMAIEMEHLYRAQNAEYSLGVIYEQQGRFKEATIAFHKHIELRDSLMGDEQREELARLEMQYELGKRDAETAAQIQRHRAERNSMIAGGVALLLVAVGGFFIYKQRQEGLRRQQDLSFRATLSETEMKILRLQMNPHFIFNSLNSISDYISKNDIEKADYYLAKFAKVTRGILENSAETLIPLSEELTMIEAYMQLEASRLNGKFTYEIHIADDLDAGKVEIPPLILQPFVENSIWHGISPKEGQGKITIEVTRDNQMYQCVIEDDGVGRYGQDSAAPAAGTRKSYGVSITQDRIAMLNKLQHANASVHIIDLEKGTRVEVNLPLTYEA